MCIRDRIKVLRLLGITLDEIKELYMQEETLETVIEHRLMQIEEEETRLKEVRRTCENILQSRMDLESLDQSILDGDGTFWKERLQKVLAEDMSCLLYTSRNIWMICAMPDWMQSISAWIHSCLLYTSRCV